MKTRIYMHAAAFACGLFIIAAVVIANRGEGGQPIRFGQAPDHRIPRAA